MKIYIETKKTEREQYTTKKFLNRLFAGKFYALYAKKRIVYSLMYINEC